MSQLSWYEVLTVSALWIPVWVTVLVALMEVTTNGRPRRALFILLCCSPLLTWAPAALALAVSDSGWVPGGERFVPMDSMNRIFIFGMGGIFGFRAWLVCLVCVGVSRYVDGLGRFLRGWPFWTIPPAALAVAWWPAHERLANLPYDNFLIAFGGTGLWVLSALWVGMLLLRNRRGKPTGTGVGGGGR